MLRKLSGNSNEIVIGQGATGNGTNTATIGTGSIPLYVPGGIANMAWTQVNNAGNNGYFSYPGPNGKIYYILTGTVRSTDTSFFYIYAPVAIYFTGYIVYGGYNSAQPQAQNPSAGGYPTATKRTEVSFNWNGSPVGNEAYYIQYTIFGNT
jgi:hypothetical protein